MHCAGERLATKVAKKERVFTESEVRAMLMRASHLAEQHTGKWVSFGSILDPA